MELKEICEEYKGVWYGEINGDEYIINQLAFHVSLLKNPVSYGGHEERYCFHNVELALIALEEMKTSNELQYWKKWHNKGISIACGNLAFKDGVPHKEGFEDYSVCWNVDELAKQYPFINPAMDALFSAMR